jgi:hypothetical protein
MELCARYSITGKTGYKWLACFEEGGRAGLRDRLERRIIVRIASTQ